MTWARDDDGVWRAPRLAVWRTLRGWRWVCYTADGSVWRSGTEARCSDAKRAAQGAAHAG